MDEQHVMAELVQAAGRQLQPGREQARRMAEFDERPALVEREKVPCPIAKFFGHVASVVR